MGTLVRNGVKIGGTTVYVDDELSLTSSNPVENKIVTSALNEKANTSSLADVATTGSYNDLTNTPTIDDTLSTTSPNAVQNKIITEGLDEKYPMDYDIPLSLAEWEALGNEKYYDHKNYYIYDAGVPTEKTIVYGWHINPNESDPSAAINYTKDAVNMTPASMGTTSFNYGSWQNAFFMPKPCMVKENGEVDYYLNENDYKQKKDTITITSTPENELPLSFNSVDDGKINYHFYGDSDGSGVQTENLFDKNAKDTSNGYRANFYLLDDGSEMGSTSNSVISEYITIPSGVTNVSLLVRTEGVVTNPSIVFYDVNKAYLSGEKYANRQSFTINVPNDAVFIRLSGYDTTTLVSGSTAPASFVPYGYKIPILLESGVTENLFDIDDPDILDNYAINNGVISPAQGWFVTGYIPVKPNTHYIRTDSGRSIIEYDNEYNEIRSTNTYNNELTTSSNGAFIKTNASMTVKSTYMFVEGSTFPDHYIPHRYTSNYDLFIGDTKLGAEEYVDYQEQKIYKLSADLWDVNGMTTNQEGTPRPGNEFETLGTYVIENNSSSTIIYYREGVSIITGAQGSISAGDKLTIQTTDTLVVWLTDQTMMPYISVYRKGIPTDPPVPFLTLNAYIGENTLSSTETLNNFSIYAISDISDISYNGNAMMEWPLIWWKYEAGNIDGEGYFYVSNRKVDDNFNCWSNINSLNHITDHFYTAIYNGGIYNGKLRSMSGYKLITKTSTNYSNTSTYAINDIVLYNSNMYICITAVETPEEFDDNKWVQIPINGGTTATQEINSAIANNTTSDVEWYIDTWSDRMLINGLLILMGKSLNSQAIFGRGLDSGAQSAKEAYVTGTLNDKGLFWGVTSAGTSGVKVFGMENWYSCAYRRTVGLIGLANGNTAYKMTYGTADGTTVNGYNITGEGYSVNTVARPANEYVKSCKFGDFGYLPLSTTGGSASTYYADYWYTNNSALTFALVGGTSNAGVYGGISFFRLNVAASNASWNVTAALTLKPLID